LHFIETGGGGHRVTSACFRSVTEDRESPPPEYSGTTVGEGIVADG